MGYALNHTSFGALAAISGNARNRNVAHRGFLSRLFSAFINARQRQADSEIERYFVRSGKVMTDSIEREMMQRALSGNWTTRG